MNPNLLVRLVLVIVALGALANCTSSSDCRGQYPRSQTVSQPCCPMWGVDACGAGLFCAALDGRTQATCYVEHSRLPGDECTADNQCASLSCNTTLHRCRYITTCDPCVGCGPVNGMQTYCDTTTATGPVCLMGTMDTEHSPACEALLDAGTGDAGSVDATQLPPAPTSNVDLLIEIDNSSSMRTPQTFLFTQINALFSAMPGLDLHVGVISTDLGTPGSSVPGCVSENGDDGLLNPIRNGAALQQHEPWASAIPQYMRPADCTDPNEFPSFLSFSSDSVDQRSVACNVGIYTGGCALEQQLEAIYRALIEHDASDAAGNTSPNAGFLRSDSILALLVLSDDDDGSVRDCNHANGAQCNDATDVFNASSTVWADMELNMRLYMYQPGSSQDPTWSLDRYVNPRNITTGLLGLRPGHPERVVFAAITGVPLALPMRSDSVDWNGLLGTPSARGSDDFYGRDSSRLGDVYTPLGPISMAQAHRDPDCSSRVEPACRRGSTPSCFASDQYFAWPARRIAEIARRFSESAMCGGAACSNGFVSSICADAFNQPLAAFGARIAQRAAGQ